MLHFILCIHFIHRDSIITVRQSHATFQNTIMFAIFQSSAARRQWKMKIINKTNMKKWQNVLPVKSSKLTSPPNKILVSLIQLLSFWDNYTYFQFVVFTAMSKVKKNRFWVILTKILSHFEVIQSMPNLSVCHKVFQHSKWLFYQ